LTSSCAARGSHGLANDDFFTDEECDRYVTMSLSDKKQVMEVVLAVGKTLMQGPRTSGLVPSLQGVPELMSKASDYWD
jgi:hypothetical protein